MIYEITTSEYINTTLLKMKSGDSLILRDGVYREKIEVLIDNITISAKNPGNVIITNKDYYHKIMADNNECNTFRTYTMYIEGDNIRLENLIIQNEATPSYIYGQAVALHVNGNNFFCQNCIIQSAQDTLFTGPLPQDLLVRYEGFYSPEKLQDKPTKQIYKNCKIIGDVDFIFGCATALFDSCDIIIIDSHKHAPSYICAPAHSKELPFGYLFYKCNLIGTSKTYLARPWRDYGCVAFIECDLNSHILPEGFAGWQQREKTARFYEYSPNTATEKRVVWSKQLSSCEAKNYFLEFINFLSTKD